MNFFDQLKTAALDFVKTPFAQKLAFGDNGAQPSNTAPVVTATASPKPSPAWLWPAVIGGGVLVLALVWAALRGK